MPLISKSFSELITFTRASSATYFAANGVLTSAANNQVRFDYNPATYIGRGILIEEARTNSIRNNTMVGAVAGTPGTLPTNWAPTTSTVNGITRTIVGTGIENGITYIDIQYAGTATANANINISADQNNFIAALQNQVWTFSAYFRLVGGSFANLTSNALYINSYTSGGAFDANATSAVSNYVAPTGSALNTQRYFFTGTLSSAATGFVNGGLYMTFNSGAVINFTLRIGLPQLEQGAFATSVIPTTTTGLTRSADVASVNTLSPWFNSAAGSWYVETISPPYFGAGYYPTNVQFTDGTSNNTMATMFNTNGAPRAERTASGVVAGSLNTAPVATINTLTKQAFAYALNDFALVANGGTPATSAAGNVPTGLTQMTIGALFTGNKPNSYLRRITYYPTRLSNAQLQTITT